MIPSPHIFTLFPYTTLFRSNYRNIGSSCELGDRALLGVAYHHRVDIPTHDTTGVVDGFPFGHRRKRKPCRITDGTTQPAESSTKTHSCTGAGLEKQIAQYCSFEHTRYFLPPGDGLHDICQRKQFFYTVTCELIDR